MLVFKRLDAFAKGFVVHLKTRRTMNARNGPRALAVLSMMCLVVAGLGVPANAEVPNPSAPASADASAPATGEPGDETLASTAWLIGKWVGSPKWPEVYCLEDPGASYDNVQQVIWGCRNAGGQYYPNGKWYLDDSANSGHYNIRNYLTGKCLTILNADIVNNTPIIQYPCNRGSNEVWLPVSEGVDFLGDDEYSWRSEANTGYCITVQNASSAPGAKIILYRCAGDDNQRWTWWHDEG